MSHIKCNVDRFVVKASAINTVVETPIQLLWLTLKGECLPPRRVVKNWVASKPVVNDIGKSKMVPHSTVWQWSKKEGYKRKEGGDEENEGIKVECLEEDRTPTVWQYVEKLAERGTQKSKGAVGRWLRARGWTRIKETRVELDVITSLGLGALKLADGGVMAEVCNGAVEDMVK